MADIEATEPSAFATYFAEGSFNASQRSQVLASRAIARNLGRSGTYTCAANSWKSIYLTASIRSLRKCVLLAVSLRAKAVSSRSSAESTLPENRGNFDSTVSISPSSRAHCHNRIVFACLTASPLAAQPPQRMLRGHEHGLGGPEAEICGSA